MTDKANKGTNKVWNLMFRMGQAGNVVSSSGNPTSRKEALEGAAVITKNGWRVRGEHHKTGKVLYQNPAELAHQKSISDDKVNGR